MGKKDRSAGVEFYQSLGFEKQMLIHVSSRTHADLKRLALEAEESLQALVRKILENHVKNKIKRTKKS